MKTTHKAPSFHDHSEDRRCQILRAAMTCFARRGFHYFESKNVVIALMVREHLEDLCQVLEQARRAA